MSIKLMSRCFDADVAVEGAEQVLLLRLCDMANDDGWCWPCMLTLSVAIRRTERMAQKLIRGLKEKGLIEVVVGGGRRHTNRYRVTLPAKVEPGASGATGNTRTNRDSVKPMTPNPVSVNRSDIKPRSPVPETPKPSTEKGELASSPEPSVNRHEPPPTQGQAGGVGVATASITSEQQQRFVALLTRYGVADGPKAAHRWWVQSGMNPLVETFEHRRELVGWCIEEARRRRRHVSYASDVVDLVDEWAPDELLVIEDDETAPTDAAQPA